MREAHRYIHQPDPTDDIIQGKDLTAVNAHVGMASAHAVTTKLKACNNCIDVMRVASY
jgi:hypothetical protein